ncbi:hypothetical protein KL86DES1_20616 [uncultured Desulfovibrio sp.]|uniref:Uncharacterized protein n=1 Tax=uncultured Desulfovibrio sp. TaxID=167968 RepID=A0A212L4E8_9BACT|nr:hypothetical protein KL86DES1_20616 [uncultured Desulfovibrio sp.]VZH33519.1 conserved protein of unknown function [Desulfovibrio sp. 86]
MEEGSQDVFGDAFRSPQGRLLDGFLQLLRDRRPFLSRGHASVPFGLKRAALHVVREGALLCGCACCEG